MGMEYQVLVEQEVYLELVEVLPAEYPELVELVVCLELEEPLLVEPLVLEVLLVAN
jgi:hypothetical protein